MTTVAEYLDASGALDADVGSTPLPGVRVYLGLDASDDAITRAWYATAIQWVDGKLSSRDFVDDNGADINPPDPIVIGVYEYVRVMHAYQDRENVLARKVQTGARAEEYPEAGVAGRVSAAALAAWPYIEPYCEDPTLYCSGGIK